MSATGQAYIASAIPAKVVRTGGTTLFHLAVSEFGDATLWTEIAALNGLTDPWIYGAADILIPPNPQKPAPGADGILGA